MVGDEGDGGNVGVVVVVVVVGDEDGEEEVKAPEVVVGHGSPEMEVVASACPWWRPIVVALEDKREL